MTVQSVLWLLRWPEAETGCSLELNPPNADVSIRHKSSLNTYTLHIYIHTLYIHPYMGENSRKVHA